MSLLYVLKQSQSGRVKTQIHNSVAPCLLRGSSHIHQEPVQCGGN